MLGCRDYYIDGNTIYKVGGAAVMSGCEKILDAFLNLGMGVVASEFNEGDTEGLEEMLAMYILEQGNCINGSDTEV
jgi:hypothetical protein